MRIAVLGATGLLGQALVREQERELLTGFSSRDVDIRDRSQIQRTMRAAQPDQIILSAAYTDVDGCESNRELAFAVNAAGAENVARVAKEISARLLFVSTDYVFDGTNTSPYETGHPRHPINVYGESKARAEESLLDILPEVCVVRTSWLFGHGGKCFPTTILKLAASRPEISVVNDQRGSPTLTDDLASALLELCRKSARGIVHATNSGDCTWYDFAREIVAMSNLPTSVKPVSTDEFPRPARRPQYSVLSPRSLNACGIQMPSWQDALRRYLGATSATAV